MTNVGDIDEVFRPVEFVGELESSNSPAGLLTGLNQQPYISAEDKLALEKQIPSRIRPFLELHSEDLSSDIQLATQEDPETYLCNLARAWEDHIAACREAATFLYSQKLSLYPSWCEAEWRFASNILGDVLTTDRIKNIYSSGIKKKVEAASDLFADEYGWSQEDKLLCLTPAAPAFHSLYRLEHAEFFLMSSEDQAQVMPELAVRYHHGDEELMKLRMDAMNFSRTNRAKLKDQVAEQRRRIDITRCKKEAFMAQYPETYPINALLEFDHWQEYLFVYGQAAYPDIHLREEILRQATMLDLADTSRDALSFNRDVLSALVELAISKVEKKFTAPLINYRQTNLSCGVSCVMTVLGPDTIPHTINTEMALWYRAGAPYNFPGGMANILLEYGLDVTYFLDKARHFDDSEYPVANITHDSFEQNTAKQYVDLHNEATLAGMRSRFHSLQFEEVVKGIKSGQLFIVGIHMPGDPYTLHWVVAHGYSVEGGKHMLAISDPLGYMTNMTQDQFKDLTDTYMGKRILGISNRRRAVT